MSPFRLAISKGQAYAFVAFFVLYEFVAYAANDMVMPAMLSVVQSLNGEIASIPNAMTFYLAGGALLQWFVGPLADRYGRRIVLLTGVASFIVLNCAIVFATNMYQFNSLRFLQGAGLAIVSSVGYPLVHETFHEIDAVRITALMANAALISPLVGPLAGTFIATLGSWQIIFLITALLAAIAWWGVWKTAPETIGIVQVDGTTLPPTPLHFHSLWGAYRDLLKNGKFLAGAAALGFMSLPIWGWIAFSPVLLIREMGMTPAHYALWHIPVFSGLILGNLALAHLAPRVSLQKLLFLSFIAINVGLAGSYVLTVFALDNLLAFISAFSLHTFGVGLSGAIITRFTLFSSSQSKGIVAALLGILQILVYLVGIEGVIAYQPIPTLGVFAAACLVWGILASVSLWIFLPLRSRHTLIT